ncbi:MAG TPA: anthranilate synthase component I, partial [Natrialbaceae archaeon]|nr:anthranilate synthase component I [Natrialbaceae archaeon]
MVEPTVATTLSDFSRTARDAPAGARIPIEVELPVDDPFEAYRRARDGSTGFVFETTGGQSGWGYFGVDPVDGLTVTADAASRDGDSPTLSALQKSLDDETLVRGDCNV